MEGLGKGRSRGYSGPMDLSRISLARYPDTGPANLRAWDAADQFLLRQLTEDGLPLAGRPVLVVNDAFGALTVALALAGARVVTWSDSRLSELALDQNLAAAGLEPGAVIRVPGHQDPTDQFPEQPAHLVLLKIPKNLAWWRDSLLRLRPVLAPDTVILSGGMIKHIPRRAYTQLQESLGPTRTGLGWKKARLAHSSFDRSLVLPPGEEEARVKVPDFNLVLHNRANVFSRQKLDLGARLLLAHLPQVGGGARVADLGCGNGVLALACKRQYPEAEILGIDESYQAVASARDNARDNGLAVDCQVGIDLSLVAPGSLDLVLCNPPFHQDRVVGDAAARAMFATAHRALRPGGELRLVGNAHLGYHARLKELFGGCALVAEDRKFVVLSARR